MAETLERIRRKRAGLRITVDECVTLLETGLAQLPLPVKSLERTCRELEEHVFKLKDYDLDFEDCLVSADDYSDDVYNAERTAILGYTRKVREIMERVTDALTPQAKPHGTGSASSMTSHKLSIRLPKISLRKFSGELMDWLGWWAQFKTIDDSDDIHEVDKFTYLLDCMTEGSRAYEVAHQFPQSTENYPKAIAALKERFGNPKLLRQVYVRELIRMILDTRNKEKTPLGTLHDKLGAALHSLQSLGVKTDQMVEFLYPMVESSLPENTLLAWQRSPKYGMDGSAETPPCTELDLLMAFLKTEIDHEETRKLARDGFGIHSSEGKRQQSARGKVKETDEVPTAAGLYSGSSPSSQKNGCIFCGNGHASKDCRKAQRLSMEIKKGILVTKRACFICLKTGCGSRSCKEDVKCSKCGKRHYSLICPGKPRENETAQDPGTPVRTTVGALSLNFTDDVALTTLMVRIVNPMTRKAKELRLLVDCGSQRSYVSEKAAKCVGLESMGTIRINHSLFGGSEVTGQIHRVYDLCLTTQNSKKQISLTMMDHPNICGPIPRVAKGAWLRELNRKRIFFTDLDPSKPPEIDVLIGAEYFGAFMTGRMIPLENGLTCIETVLGWTIIGQRRRPSDTEALSITTMAMSCATVAQLWDLETIGIRDPAETLSSEQREREAFAHFARTVKQDGAGRYSVSLPWISTGMKAALPDNYGVAVQRLQATTKKLNQLKKFEAYDLIFKQWEAEGIISTVDPDVKGQGLNLHYLPHRAVFKESKTTPVRPVFDASCKTGRNPSLNGCLEKGPNLLELIPTILQRFRMGKIGLVADIRKAFLMIELNEEDRDFVRFLWWTDASNTTVKEYRHNRVVFGMNCSPFLLAAVIRLHLQTLRVTHPEMADRIERALYVDNLVMAVDSSEDYANVKEVATGSFTGAKMELTQWERSGYVGDNAVTGVLGLKWDKIKDVLMCDILPAEIPLKTTKRVMLSRIQSIFDPLGILTPTVLIPKVLLQRSWLVDKQWDTEVPEEIEQKFKAWWAELINTKDKIQVPRDCSEGLKPNSGKLQLHVFGDASKLSYATVAFLRVDTGDEVKVHLLQAHGRLATIKKITIPRLELLSCTIAARLSSSIGKALDLEHVPLFHWSDSTTALAWIRRSSDWGTFVGNRVKEIVELTPSATWRHVPGELNPADLPSRGIAPEKFAKLRWWEGPDWLRRDQSQWPHAEPEVDETEVNQELKRISAHEVKRISTLAAISNQAPFYMPFNSYPKNLRILSHVLRFIRAFRTDARGSSGQKDKWSRNNPNPSFQELVQTELKVFKLIQQEVFSTEDRVIEGIKVERDEEGVIRSWTKLTNRQDEWGFIRPVLLPHAHPMVDALIRHTHVTNCHGGAQLLMGKLRDKVWIIRGRQAIRKAIRSCVTCKRFDARRCDVPPSSLPENRVKDASAFEVSGVDLAGPLTLRDGSKAYVVLFTCAIYRCVHLEVVESLSTDDFLLAFVRFCKRKRRPTTMYSDNGTNFRGAVNLFILIDWDAVVKRTEAEKVDWHFNPPAAPWWGGWWERLIRSVKDLLRRMLGNRRLTYVQLETCLCEVEAAMNQRPLSYITEDQDDLVPLTPAMFITCLPNGDCPEAKLITLESLDKRRQNLKKLLEELTGRFRKEYLAHLVHRGKEKKIRTFQVGEVVLIENEKKRMFWPMGRVQELITGSDGEIRVAKVKTKTGIFTRPLQRLFPLEVGPLELPTIPFKVAVPPACQKKVDPATVKVNTGPKRITTPKESAPALPPTVVTKRGRQVVPPTKFKDFD